MKYEERLASHTQACDRLVANGVLTSSHVMTYCLLWGDEAELVKVISGYSIEANVVRDWLSNPRLLQWFKRVKIIFVDNQQCSYCCADPSYVLDHLHGPYPPKDHTSTSLYQVDLTELEHYPLPVPPIRYVS